jgi:hypothetical protein
MRDIDNDVRERARQRLLNAGIVDEVRALDEVIAPSGAERNRAFGEPLPNGLRLGSGPQNPSAN